jgi:PadR family transcriptional regulator, regulatory protein PadR
MTKPTDLVQGTLDLLIMRVIATEQLHGWAIAQRIQLLSRDVLQVNQGSLYPALYRLEHQGWIASEWGTSENNRKAKFYRLTQEGRRQLDAETENWERVSAAIDRILETA